MADLKSQFKVAALRSVCVHGETVSFKMVGQEFCRDLYFLTSHSAQRFTISK